MECICAQSRPRFILSFERVLREWSQNPGLLLGKIPSTGKDLLSGGSNSRRCIKQDSKPNALPTSYFGPQLALSQFYVWVIRNFYLGEFCLLVGCLTSQQHASVSQGRICTDNLTCCHTEMEAADQTFHLTQSQYTDTGPTSPSADPIMPDAWQGSHWSANFEVTGMTRPRKNPAASGFRTRDLSLSRRTP